MSKIRQNEQLIEIHFKTPVRLLIRIAPYRGIDLTMGKCDVYRPVNVLMYIAMIGTGVVEGS